MFMAENMFMAEHFWPKRQDQQVVRHILSNCTDFW